jgi:hypothetical protein
MPSKHIQAHASVTAATWLITIVVQESQFVIGTIRQPDLRTTAQPWLTLMHGYSLQHAVNGQASSAHHTLAPLSGAALAGKKCSQ